MNVLFRIVACCAAVLVAGFAPPRAQEPLKVCATVTDLGDLCRQIGGDQVSVTVFANGVQDAHFVEARPSFIKALSQADLYLQLGLDLEIGWAPVLLRNARNPAVQPNGSGYLDISRGIQARDVPLTPVDRSMGDVHARGNPHYLLDPLNGLIAARMIRDKLEELRPASKELFEKRFTDFRTRLGKKLVGDKLADLYDFEKLALLYERGKLVPFLESQHAKDLLGGWLGAMAPYRGAKAVSDHAMWPYMAARFGLQIVGHLEPLPGVPPTTRHLADLIDVMKQQHVQLILAASYYDPRHARFVAEHTDAQVVEVAHQVGSRPGTDDYLSMVDYNVHALVEALKSYAAAH